MAEINDKWNLMVQEAKNFINKPEAYIQSKWVIILSEIFGYRAIDGEIVEHETITIGSTKSTIPDILIKKNQKNLFVVELKCYVPKQKQYVEQLISYMKLLDLEIGLLVCNKIYIVCKDTSGKYEYIEIPFEQNNENGEFFVELFQKENFDTAMIKDFVFDINKKRAEIEAVSKALDEICADGKGFLKKYLAENKYSVDIVDQVFEDITVNVCINRKGATAPLSTPENRPIPPKAKMDQNSLTKTEAIKMFEKRHNNLWSNHTTFASKNNGTNNFYWANPSFTLLHNNWHIILNDWLNRTLYLFYIPANDITEVELKSRKDKSDKIDLQIIYQDPNFTDSRSGYKFLKYKVDEIKY